MTDGWSRRSSDGVFIEMGEDPYWIYKVLVKCHWHIYYEDIIGYKAKLLYHRNRDLFDHLQKHCFFQIIKRTVQKALLHSKYMDDYLIEFVVRR